MLHARRDTRWLTATWQVYFKSWTGTRIGFPPTGGGAGGGRSILRLRRSARQALCARLTAACPRTARTRVWRGGAERQAGPGHDAYPALSDKPRTPVSAGVFLRAVPATYAMSLDVDECVASHRGLTSIDCGGAASGGISRRSCSSPISPSRTGRGLLKRLQVSGRLRSYKLVFGI